MKKKNTSLKNNLLASMMTMLLCVAMLITTTFAWFTDSVSNTGNKITAGNLNIDLIHVGGGTDGTDVSIKENPSHLIFNYDKWEPNYTVMETLKVENKGDLALKFSLTALTPNPTLGANGENLAEVIDVYVYEGQGIPTPASFAEMTQANSWRNAGSLLKLMNDTDDIAHGVLLPTGAAETYSEPVGSVQMTIALHMKETAGNAYQGLSLGDLNFTLNATQYTYEEDAFGDQYDANAEYPWDGKTLTPVTPDENGKLNVSTGAELAWIAQQVNSESPAPTREATKDTFNIVLNSDIDLNGQEWTPIGGYYLYKGTFDGNGYTIKNLKSSHSANPSSNNKHVGLIGMVKISQSKT